MSLSLIIRTAEPSDEPVLYEFISDLEETALPRADFTKIFLENLSNDRIRYFIAEHGGRAVGMGSCYLQLLLHHAGLVAEIQEIYVLPEYRSMGVGAKLTETLIGFARHEGAVQVEVCSNKKRTGAHRFYEKTGFGNNHFKFVCKFPPENNS